MAFKVQRGTNISHWLSQSQARGEDRRNYFTRDDVCRLRDAGLDHLRIPVDESQLWEAGEVGRQERHREAFDLLNAALDWCEAAGLRAIVDLHILRSHHFQQKTPALFTQPIEAERFAWLWQDLSSELKARRTDQVAYELMNEPVAPDSADWNRVYRHPYQALRALEPDRTLVLGSNKWNQCATFDELDVPDDPRLLLTFHFYNPMLITHYQAPWSKRVGQYRGPIQYPGRPIPPADWDNLPDALRAELAKDNEPYGIEQMRQAIAKPLAVAARTGLGLYCGEFGVIHKTPAPLRIEWYRDFRSVMAEHGIGWANWDYKGDFALIDGEGQPTSAWVGLLG
ncbi:MAG: glycoside hydrolase family 5 protein [Tepidisphaeraceae bacterium]